MMINVLLPMAGQSALFDPQLYPYPLPLTEVCGKPLIEHVITNLQTLDADIRFIFVVKAEDCRRFHLDHTLSLLAPGRCEIVQLAAETKGALCSAMMAIAHIANEDPLVVANFDQLIEPGLGGLFAEFKRKGCDAGCLTFDAVHPRWSYVKLEGDQVVEAAEKKPISRNAIAGFYYFSSGNLFVEAAKRTIYNGAAVGDLYYVSLVFNELILEGKRITSVPIDVQQYHSFYTPQRIEEYERQHLISGAVAKTAVVRAGYRAAVS
ncbi:MAG TPA: glycosyltransferase family 2 protein [Aquabacterium sp.]|nr:glycosyltransferase family 2 protein [Aquabacterium sp.]